MNAAKVDEGSTVVVLGCGGVGLSTMLGALYRKAGRVIAIDVNPARLELANQFGASETLLADRADTGLLTAATEIKRRTGGRGADYAFECTAVPELGSAPLAMIRSAGTAVGVSGIEKIVASALPSWTKLFSVSFARTERTASALDRVPKMFAPSAERVATASTVATPGLSSGDRVVETSRSLPSTSRYIFKA